VWAYMFQRTNGSAKQESVKRIEELQRQLADTLPVLGCSTQHKTLRYLVGMALLEIDDIQTALTSREI